MSVEAITWVLDQEAGSPGAKLVLMCLANYADKYGYCWPSQQLICEQSEQGERTVRRHIEALETQGLLKRDKRRQANGGFCSDSFQLNLTQRPIWPAARMTDGQKRPQPAANLAGNPSEENHQSPTTARARIAPIHQDGDLIPCPQPIIPTDQTKSYLAIHAGVKQLPELITAEFSSHYHGTGQLLTQEGWQGRFRKWVIREVRYGSAKPKRDPRTNRHTGLVTKDFSSGGGSHGRL